MYFELQPKSRKEDFFGADFLLASLFQQLADASVRLMVIKGLRRTGKTSLLNVALAESRAYSVKVDVRESPYHDRRDFFLYLTEKIKSTLGESLFEKIAKKVAGIELSYQGLAATIWLSKEQNVSRFLEKINSELKSEKKILLIAFDEAQLLKQIEFDYLLASIFDNYPQIKLVLTGSEIGLLDTFLGKQDYHAPLYGRAYGEIELKRLKPEESAAFLQKGFEEIQKKISLKEIQEVIEYLDGIIGWITHYGWLRHQNQPHERAIELVQEQGKEIVRRELQLFLERRKAKEKYRQVLYFIAKGSTTWSLLQDAFRKKRIKATNSQLSLYLKELLDYGFIEKTIAGYHIPDPVLLKAIKE